MNVITISISYDARSNGLTLSDGTSTGPDITTVVSPNDVVVWQLTPDSGIDSIDAIHDSSTTDLFTPDPVKLGNSVWQGTVGNFPSKAEEAYCIYYTRRGVQNTHDPKIQMH